MTAVMPSLPLTTTTFQRAVDQSVQPTKVQSPTGSRGDKLALDLEAAQQAKNEQSNGTILTRRPSEKKYTRGRQSSLRNVKNSKELLRQRSSNRGNKEVAPDGLSGGREGRQFTVANVGNNGRIYLR